MPPFLDLEMFPFESNLVRNQFLLDEPTSSSSRLTPGLQFLAPTLGLIILIEYLLQFVVPLSEGLIHGHLTNDDSCEGDDVGTSLVH